MWVFLALGAALLASFNPILYKRLLTQASPIVAVWSALGLALPLLALTTLASAPTLRRRLQHAVPDLSLPSHRREWLLAALIAGLAPAFGHTAMSLGLVRCIKTGAAAVRRDQRPGGRRTGAMVEAGTRTPGGAPPV